MEWSIHVAGAAELSAELPAPPVAGARFTRCAFGTEFCENLLPSPDGLESARRAASGRGLDFTFLTPYVGNSGLRKLAALFPLLADGDEVVFADWGVLNVLRREFPGLRPVQGRLLNKSLRDPRVMGVYAAAPSPDAVASSTLAALRGSNLDNESYTRLLLRLGVTSVELDNLPQGMDLSFGGRGLGLNVYFPFGFISTSRVCMAAGLHYPKQEKFQPAAPCRHECQTHQVEYSYTNSPFGNRDQKFLLRGNTYFYEHTGAMMRSLLELGDQGGISRLVFQPRIPMVES